MAWSPSPFCTAGPREALPPPGRCCSVPGAAQRSMFCRRCSWSCPAFWCLSFGGDAAGAALACVPWTWRNYRALHGFCFIRSNLGLELRIANQDDAAADIDVTLARKGTLRHPSENLEEARQVQDLGESEYMRRARREAIDWIKAHPAEFLRLTAMRVVHFWCGPWRLPWLALLTTAISALALLGLRRVLPTLDAPHKAGLIIPLATFPVVYYIVSYVEHYPMPLAWILLLLASYEIRCRWAT